MSSKPRKDDDYYPLRWKFADWVENIIILYQTKAAIAIAVFGVLVVLGGLVILGWNPFSGGDDEVVAQNDEVADVTEAPAPTINPATVNRPVATEDQVLSTTAGTVIELGPRTMRIVGGAPTDEVADAALDLAVMLFPNQELLDAQLLSTQFGETTEVFIRVIEPTFFQGETADLNEELSFLVGDVAEAVRVNPNGATVLVVGHAATGPLSIERAESVSNELISAGLTMEEVSFTGVGNSEPIPGAESRIEFILR